MAGRKQSKLAREPAADGGPPPPSVVYAVYLDTLPKRPNHGDGTFPAAAVAQLATEIAAGRRVETGAQWAVWSGPWWVAQSAAMAERALGATRFGPAQRTAVAWAALLLPVGVLLGPRLVGAMGGDELWRGSTSALRAAAFAGRLEGIPHGVRGLLARLGSEDGRAGDERWERRVGRMVLALAAAADSLGLAVHVAGRALRPGNPVALGLAMRYRGRMEVGGKERVPGA